jgi:hypothetical protein
MPVHGLEGAPCAGSSDVLAAKGSQTGRIDLVDRTVLWTTGKQVFGQIRSSADPRTT